MPTYRPKSNRFRVATTSIVLAALVIVCYGFWASAHAAYEFDYDSVLGSPLIGHIYPPFAWMVWSFKYYHADAQLFSTLYWSFSAITAAALVAAVIAIGLLTRRLPEYSDVHGTAKFLDKMNEIKHTGLLTHDGQEHKDGVLLAIWDERVGRLWRRTRRHYLRHPQIEHIQVFGPPGSGKGVAFVYNAIQTWNSSMVVLDRKGSLHEMTSGHLQRRGYRVLRWAPLEPNNTIGINIVNSIREDENYEVGDAMNFARSILPPGKEGSEGSFFTDAGYRMLASVVLYTVRKVRVEERRRATLKDLVAMFGKAHTTTGELYDAMIDNRLGWVPSLTTDGQQERNERGVPLYRPHEWIADMGSVAKKGGKSEKTDANIFETAFQRLFAATDPQVHKATAESGFTFDQLMNDEKKIALFLVVPPGASDLQRLSGVVTTMLSMMIETPMRKPLKPEAGKNVSPHKRPLMMLLDEIGNMGRVNSLPDALTLLREWGVKVIGVWQTKAQIEGNYGDKNPILGASEIALSFATNDDNTADWLSRSLGKTTNVITNLSMSGHRFSAGAHNMSLSTTTNERALMTPDETRRLKAPEKDSNGRVVKPGEIIILKRGSNAIKATQALFWEIPAFNGFAAIPPLTVADSDDLASKPVGQQTGEQAAHATFRAPLAKRRLKIRGNMA